MSITTQRLRHVLALSEHLNFARAAESLHITQPALSRSILALEDSLGARLFDRRYKGVVPTVFGVLVARQAKEILQRVDTMEREVKLLKGHGIGAVAIGAGPIVAASHVGRAIGRMNVAHPNVKVTVRIDSWKALGSRLKSGELELFIGESAEAFDSSDLEVTPLLPRRVVFFARSGHPLAKRSIVRLSDLQKFPLAGPIIPPRVEDLLRKGNTNRAWWGDFPQVPPAIECESYPLIKSVVAASDAISGAPITIIEDELRDGILTLLAVQMPDVLTQFGIVQSSTRTLSPAAEAFIGHLIKEDKKA